MPDNNAAQLPPPGMPLHLRRRWRWLIDPKAMPPDQEIRRLSEILQTLLRIMLPMIVATGIIGIPVLTGASPLWESSIFIGAVLGAVMMLAAYALNLWGHYHSAAALFTGSFFASPWLTVSLDASPRTLTLGGLGVAGVLLANILFRTYVATLVAGFVAVGGILLLPVVVPTTMLADVLPVLVVNMANFTGVLVFAYYRDLLESERKAELEQAIATSEEHLANLHILLEERTQGRAERETLIMELEAKNAELERFTYTVSHDLKSPLITMRGFLGYITQDAKSGNLERLEEDVQRVVTATDKMHRMLDELLELSRIGRKMNPPERLPYAAVVREAIENVQGQIDATGAEVVIAEQLPVVYGDRLRLVEVVQNLVDNAVKFMGEQPQPRIEIGIRNEKTPPVFYIRDNGQGIAPKYHQKIFGLFETLDAKSAGTGVGLALVKRIVEFYNGNVWVESDESGNGSTFCFVLPDATAENGEENKHER